MLKIFIGHNVLILILNTSKYIFINKQNFGTPLKHYFFFKYKSLQFFSFA